MTKVQKLALMKERLNKMENSRAEMNNKCPGAKMALKREIRNMEAAIASK